MGDIEPESEYISSLYLWHIGKVRKNSAILSIRTIKDETCNNETLVKVIKNLKILENISLKKDTFYEVHLKRKNQIQYIPLLINETWNQLFLSS